MLRPLQPLRGLLIAGLYRTSFEIEDVSAVLVPGTMGHYWLSVRLPPGVPDSMLNFAAQLRVGMKDNPSGPVVIVPLFIRAE
jgi:hypothetical protein